MVKILIFIAAFCIVLATANPISDEQPEPYSFQYSNSDVNGTISRQEAGDAQGFVQGEYSFELPNGLRRTVKYYSDAEGFHADVVSNEPGLITHQPAHATYTVQ